MHLLTEAPARQRPPPWLTRSHDCARSWPTRGALGSQDSAGSWALARHSMPYSMCVYRRHLPLLAMAAMCRWSQPVEVGSVTETIRTGGGPGLLWGRGPRLDAVRTWGGPGLLWGRGPRHDACSERAGGGRDSFGVVVLVASQLAVIERDSTAADDSMPSYDAACRHRARHTAADDSAHRR